MGTVTIVIALLLLCAVINAATLAILVVHLTNKGMNKPPALELISGRGRELLRQRLRERAAKVMDDARSS